jgi:hypothetical protein
MARKVAHRHRRKTLLARTVQSKQDSASFFVETPYARPGTAQHQRKPMTKPLSEQLADLSVRATTDEQPVAFIIDDDEQVRRLSLTCFGQ